MAEAKLSGGIRLFKIFGITVFLHWSWFIIAAYDLRSRFSLLHNPYQWQGFHVLEYLAVFVIILLHEFGHALASRSVGGSADRIMLWPLGGVAFVRPPQRPGAVLWSIAAGPLVNVALIPVTFGAMYLLNALPNLPADLRTFVLSVTRLNLLLLAFNMLPIYPLDGGQILQSLLWFVMGRIWSLRVAAVIGVIGAAAVAVLGYLSGNDWLIVMAVFGIWQCVNGIRYAASLGKLAKMPRHAAYRCPACGTAPLQGNFWRCACGEPLDLFAANFSCPACGRTFSSAQCVECGKPAPADSWKLADQAAKGGNVAI
jgi:Zn-dependent protease